MGDRNRMLLALALAEDTVKKLDKIRPATHIEQGIANRARANGNANRPSRG